MEWKKNGESIDRQMSYVEVVVRPRLNPKVVLMTEEQTEIVT